MRFKLDENLGSGIARILREAGHRCAAALSMRDGTSKSPSRLRSRGVFCFAGPGRPAAQWLNAEHSSATGDYAPRRPPPWRAADVSTVFEQKLYGATDDTIYNVCRQERRCLVTLDLDFGDGTEPRAARHGRRACGFSNVLRFPPEPTAGIVVLRPPSKAMLGVLATLARQMAKGLEKERLDGRLWIVEMERVRIHQASEPDN